jgi:hypothetical protein
MELMDPDTLKIPDGDQARQRRFNAGDSSPSKLDCAECVIRTGLGAAVMLELE